MVQRKAAGGFSFDRMARVYAIIAMVVEKAARGFVHCRGERSLTREGFWVIWERGIPEQLREVFGDTGRRGRIRNYRG